MKQTIAQFLNIKEFPFEIKDSKGNIIYLENSDGVWYKQEFDFNFNPIYFESSNGYRVKKEFDSNGNVTYSEDSNGKKEYYGPKPSCEDKIVEIDGVEYKLSKL